MTSLTSSQHHSRDTFSKHHGGGKSMIGLINSSSVNSTQAYTSATANNQTYMNIKASMMPQILNNTMGSAAASLTFSQNNTPLSHNNDLSEHAKVGPMNQSYVVPRPFMVPGPKQPFTNELLRPLN